MSKMRIGKLLSVCFLVALLCFVTSCKQQETTVETTKDETGTVYVLNPFETTRDMFSIRQASGYMSAAMEIVDAQNGQVKAGEGSMKYTFEQGNWPDMVLHIRESAYPELDIANLNKMNLAVYNDNDTAVNGVITVAVGGNKALLTKEFTLEPKQWNDLEFRLSALACKFNAEQILGFRFRMEAPENSVFYFDQWTVTMGAENTAEDDQWEPKLMDIIDRIDSLPAAISVSDEAMLETLYMEYAELPDVYRNIVPNYNVLESAIAEFAKAKFAAQEDALERSYLAFDEFYGIGQITSANYPILYQTEVKYGEQKGSLKITFDGSTKESYFPFYSPLDPKRYDYMEISVYNDDDVRKVIYFNWNQRLLVEPHSWGTMKFAGEELIANGNLIVDSVDELGTRIQSRGTIYLGATVAYRRDLLSELKKLPDANEFQMDGDIKYLTLIERTLELYNKTSEAERTQLPAELVDNLLACSVKIAGYRTVLDATQEDIEFGTPDCAAIGGSVAATDDTYGPVWELTFTEKAEGAYAAGFRFVKNMDDCQNLFFYIYNPQPTQQYMELYADGSWNSLEMRLLEPGWNKIDIPADVTTDYFIFGLFSKNADVVGTWKVSSLYEASDDIVNSREAAEVSALIGKLPAAGSIQMPDGMKYVADIWAAKDAYDALTDAGKALVSGTGKLNACLQALGGYKAAMNPNSDEMTAGTPDCQFNGAVTIGRDDTYGSVWQLHVYGIGSGDYAAGWQVEKDISADKNLFFYMYNPKDHAQIIYLYANPSWTNLEGRMLNPGWNLIEIPEDVVIDRYLFGLFPKGADVTGTWLISSVFSKAQTLVDREESVEVAEIIEALPAPDSITMPEDMKLLAAIYQAKNGYEALSSAAKQYISEAQLDKLYACVDAAEGYLVVVNALSDDMIVPPDAPCGGIVGRAEDSQYGPVFTLNITEAGASPYFGGIQFNKAMLQFSHKFFYVYNPTDTAQAMWMYADNNWEGLGLATLQPGWNKIELTDEIAVDGYLFGMFTNEPVTGTWKVSSVYALSDGLVYAEGIEQVEAIISALPAVTEIGGSHRADIAAAKEAFEKLSAEDQAKVESADKLTACLEKVAQWDAWDEKTVIHASTNMIPTNADDNTYGKVWLPTVGSSYEVIHSGSEAYAACEAIEFYIYNPKDSAVNGFIQDDVKWSNVASFTLEPQAWTKITVEQQDMGGGKNLLSAYVTMYLYVNFEGEGWKMTSIFSAVPGEPAAPGASAADVEAMLAALPGADEIGGSHKAAIKAAKEAFDKLSAEDQAEVESTDKLTACLDKVAQWDAWDEKTMIHASTGMIAAHADDNTYGTVWTPASGRTYEVIKSTAAAYAACEAIEFYIFNPTNAVVNGFIQDDVKWSNVASFALEPQVWTKITVEQKDMGGGKKLLSGNVSMYLYVNFAGQGWKMTGIFDGSAAGTAVTAVNEKIAALPEASAMMGSHKAAVKAAKEAYDALTPAEQETVSNAEKLNACVAKLNYWTSLEAKMVVDASYQVLGVDGTLTPGVDDATFGTVMSVKNSTYLAVTPNVMTENPAYKQSKNIGFYIYNPTDQDVDGNYTIDWGYYGYFRLKAKSWNYIEISDVGSAANKQFISNGGTVYFYGAYSGEGWLVSSFYSRDISDITATMVVDASYQVLGVDGTLTAGVDNSTFGKVMTVVNSTYLAITPNVMTENPAYKQSEAIVFYIYNPTDSDVDGNYTMDWGYYGHFRLKAKSWNRIVISDLGSAGNKQFISSGSTVYLYSTYEGEGWMVSSFYGM